MGSPVRHQSLSDWTASASGRVSADRERPSVDIEARSIHLVARRGGACIDTGFQDGSCLGTLLAGAVPSPVEAELFTVIAPMETSGAAALIVSL